MRLEKLSSLKRSGPEYVPISELPRNVVIDKFAISKALTVNELVRAIHGDSYEWYGFTLAKKENPECIVDIGLPVNDSNVHQFTGIGPENISLYRDALPADLIINGWIHSHGSLEYRRFSGIDEANHLTVLDYVCSGMKIAVAKREAVIDDLRVVNEGAFSSGNIGGGSVWIVTNEHVSQARIFESVYGCFAYAILVGDGGWYRQEIYHRTRGILTGMTNVAKRSAELQPVDSGRRFTALDREFTTREVREKIRPSDPFQAAEQRNPRN